MNRGANILQLLLSMTLTVFSQPVVTEVVGTMAQDGVISISGSGFGAQGPRIILFDDFENGTEGQSIQTGEGSASLGQWNTTSGDPRYSSESSVSGNLAFRADMSDGYRKFAEASLPQGGVTDLFVSWWIYLPEQDNFPGEGTEYGTNWKQLWVQGSSTTDDDLVLPVLVGNSVFLDGNDDCLGPAPTGSMHGTMERQWSFRKGRWLRLWAWVRGRADESGQIYLHELGSEGVQTLTARPSTQVQCNPGDRFEKVRINGYGRTTPNCHPMFDDVYIAAGENARARIEIGDLPVYRECTKLSAALPTLWSDSQIEARIQLGGFTEQEMAYIFIFDGEGNVSEGVPLRRSHGLPRSITDETHVVVDKPFSYSVDAFNQLDMQLASAPSWISLQDGVLSGIAPSETQQDSVVINVTSQDQPETFTLRVFVAEPLEELILDNSDPSVSSSGGWSSSSHFDGYYGPDYLYAEANSGEWFEWSLDEPRVSGVYEVFACWTEAQGRPVDVSYHIQCDSGMQIIENIDQTRDGAKWNYLGAFCFTGKGSVRLNGGTGGNEGSCADAIRLVKKAAPVKTLEPVSTVFGNNTSRHATALTMNVSGSVLDYRLPFAGRVDVTLFNMQGKRMAVLEKKMHRAGKHSVNLKNALDTKPISDQMYIVHLKHDNKVLTRRVRFD